MKLSTLIFEGVVGEVTENQVDISSVADAMQAEDPLSEGEISSSTTITEEVGPDLANNRNVADINEQSGALSQKQATTKGLDLLCHYLHSYTFIPLEPL